MTENMKKLQEAKKLLGDMITFVLIYEKGTIGDPNIFEIDLTENQIIVLKQTFVNARTSCIALLNAIEG